MEREDKNQCLIETKYNVSNSPCGLTEDNQLHKDLKSRKEKPVKMCFRNFIGDPMVRTSPSNAGEWGGGRQGQIQSVVGDLRDHMPHNQKIKKHETEAIL